MEKPKGERLDLPKEYIDKPELHLCWRGLVVSISEGFMTRKQAYAMLGRFDIQDGVEPTEIYEINEPDKTA